MENKQQYEYTYTAPTVSERKMAEEIRRRYQPQEKTKNNFARLKKLDQKVRSIPMIIGLTFGVLGTLLFGGGLATVLEKLCAHYLIVGVTLSVTGLISIAFAYPVYCKIAKKCKDKYGDEILKLSDEILKGE